jgi:hypothetical protein
LTNYFDILNSWFMKFVRIATVDNSYEAEFLKEDLEEAGVFCMLTNVHLTNLYPGLGNFYHGSGIGVMVSQQDQVKAEEIARRRNAVKGIIRCPSCGSAKVESLGVGNIWERISLISAMFFLLMPITRITDEYHCYECKSKFKR